MNRPEDGDARPALRRAGSGPRSPQAGRHATGVAAYVGSGIGCCLFGLTTEEYADGATQTRRSATRGCGGSDQPSSQGSDLVRRSITRQAAPRDAGRGVADGRAAHRHRRCRARRLRGEPRRDLLIGDARPARRRGPSSARGSVVPSVPTTSSGCVQPARCLVGRSFTLGVLRPSSPSRQLSRSKKESPGMNAGGPVGPRVARPVLRVRLRTRRAWARDESSDPRWMTCR
jgi:hypothetical protein